MSLKAGWDDADERLLVKCEVLAAWQGLRVERRRSGWALRLADNPAQPPLVRGLTIQGVEAHLLGLSERTRPPRRASKRMRTALA
jgi:hypothetical protein